MRDVVVLEARNRVGGRLLELTRPNGGTLQFGGEFTSVHQPRLLTLAEELGVPTARRGQGALRARRLRVSREANGGWQELGFGRRARPARSTTPVSGRVDEYGSVILFDRALTPWENVLILDVDLVQAFNERAAGSRAQRSRARCA